MIQLLNQIVSNLIEGMVKKGGIISAGVVKNVVFKPLISADKPTGIMTTFVVVVVLVASVAATTPGTTIVVPVGR